MQNFWRSVRYLWPYRRRLAASILCVVFISVLWGGGLGMLVPGSKILISEEGLHGWAYREIVSDRLQAKLVQRMTPPGTTTDGQDIVEILDVLSVEEGGRAQQAGLHKGDWIVGVYDGDGRHVLMRGSSLVGLLAQLPADGSAALNVYDPATRGTRRTVPVSFATVAWYTRALGGVVSVIPEPRDRPERYKMFIGVLVLTILVSILRGLLRFTQEYLVETAVNRAMMDLRFEMYSAVLHLPVTYYSEQGATDTMSRFIADSAELRQGQITLFGKTLAEPGKAIASVTASLIISWKLTVLALLVGPPAFWVIRRFGKRMKRASRKMLESWSSMIGALEETLTGIRVVKAFTMEGAERKRFFRINRALVKQFNKIAKIEAATAPTIEALGVTAGCCAAALAAYWALNYQMSTDMFIALMACMATMFDPARKLAKVSTRFQRAEAAAARVFQLHDLPGERSPPGAPRLPRHHESIVFEDVSYHYGSAADDAVKHVDLTIRAGEVLAIVGPNGSGKTTLVSLVPRLLEPTGGRILIDGQDTAAVTIRSLRQQIGLVTQDTVLFHATIAENIAYGLRRPKAGQVLDAARKAFVDEFVSEMPDGYETIVGEHGATLSGGQRQRITIARAILRDPAILIFDEATSQIDTESERRIQEAMVDFVRGRTTLLIAHHFATVMSADRIAVMNAGRVVDVGTHEQLLGRCALYAHLYETQFSGPPTAPRA